MPNSKKLQPLKCPDCGSTEVCEVSDGVIDRIFHKWDEDKHKYVEDYNDADNFGDLYLECGGCHYRYSQEEYERFIHTLV